MAIVRRYTVAVPQYRRVHRDPNFPKAFTSERIDDKQVTVDLFINDAMLASLAYQVKDALYVIKQEREDVIATLRGFRDRLRTLSTGELMAHQVANDLSGLIERMEIGNAVGGR